MTAPEPSPNRPQILLGLDEVLCDRHGELFQDRWPKGYPVFGMAALRTFLARPEVAEACGGDVALVAERFLLKSKPLCCRLSPAELQAHYRAADLHDETPGRLWSQNLCYACKAFRAGARCRVWRGGKTVKRHVCLRCVATGKVSATRGRPPRGGGDTSAAPADRTR